MTITLLDVGLQGVETEDLAPVAAGQLLEYEGGTYSGYDITGPLLVNARRITLRNCIIRGGNQRMAITVADGASLRLEQCEVVDGGIEGHGITLVRSHVHRCPGDGLVLRGQSTLIQSIVEDVGRDLDTAPGDPTAAASSDDYTPDAVGVRILGGRSHRIVDSIIDVPVTLENYVLAGLLIESSGGRADEVSVSDSIIDGGRTALHIAVPDSTLLGEVVVVGNTLGGTAPTVAQKQVTDLSDPPITWSGNESPTGEEIAEP